MAGVYRRRQGWSAFSALRPRPAGFGRRLAAFGVFGALGVLAILLAALAGFLWYRAVDESYRDAKRNAEEIQARYGANDGQTVGLSDLPQLATDLAALEADLTTLNERMDAPLLSSVARHSPYIGDQFRAGEDLVALGVELVSVVHEATVLANDVRDAFESAGMRASPDATGPTWLDVVQERRAEIEGLDARFQLALARRQQLDADSLPERGKGTLAVLDTLLARASSAHDEYFSLLPLLAPAFGAEKDARYLILLQNGEEIRQSGGFPGTFALVTIRNGQLAELEIDNIRALDWAYYERRQTPIAAPGPIRTYLRQEELLPHDALWPVDFADGAETVRSMYEIAGWPELTGIVGVNHAAFEAILELIGPYQVTIDGEQRTVDAASFLDLIESYRDLSWQDLAAHKEVVGILGSSLVDQVVAADFATKKGIFFALRESATRRQIQAHMLDEGMQAEVVRRGWHGALQPAPGVPTLAMTASNVSGGKSSTRLNPRSILTVTDPGNGPTIRVTWDISFEHNGDPAGDETYNGFQRLWVNLFLPEGATLASASRQPEPADVTEDPRAIGFNIGLMPGTTERLTIEFDAPRAAGQLLVRRQAGLNTMEMQARVSAGGCALDAPWWLERDLIVDLDACALSARP